VTATEALLRRDRLIVAFCLGVICLLSWYYLLTGAGTVMSTVAMTTWQFPPPVYSSSGTSHWPIQYWWIMIVMWWVMMIAMMVPSAAPMILLYARVKRHSQRRDGTVGGIMNLVWIAGLAIFVLLEKLLPRGVQVARVSGAVMVLAGGYLLLT